MTSVFLRFLAAISIILSTSVSSSFADTPKKGQQYAFLVACSGYNKTQLRELPHTVKDIEAFKQALLSTGFDDDRIKLFHDLREKPFLPEKAKILQEFTRLLAQVNAEDTVVVVLSGHSVHFKGERSGYFCPVDADLNDKKSLISLANLFDQFKECKAQKKLVIVNASRTDTLAPVAPAAIKDKLDDEDKDEIPQGIAAFYLNSEHQKNNIDPDYNRDIAFNHLIRAWYGEYLKDKQLHTLEHVFEQTSDRTKTDAAKKLATAQVPVVRRAPSEKWLIQTIYPAEGLFRRGDNFAYGLGEKLDHFQVLRYYREAAEKGHPLAKICMAQQYFRGNWLDKNRKEAERLFKENLPDLRAATGRNLTRAPPAPGRYVFPG